MTGVYYPVGRALCAVVNEAVGSQGPRCSVEPTPGSVYNLDALESGELDFALVQADVQYEASAGRGRWNGRPLTNLRSVLSLYPELVTIVARPDARIASIDDLKGKRVNIGNAGSGIRTTWEVIEGAFGLKRSDLALAAELRSDATTDALCSNRIDANLMLLGHPSQFVAAQLAACGLILVGVRGPAIEKLVAERPYYVDAVIPASTYGTPTDILTFGGKAALVTVASVPDDVVYAVAKAVMSNLDVLRKAQAKSRRSRSSENDRQLAHGAPPPRCREGLSRARAPAVGDRGSRVKERWQNSISSSSRLSAMSGSRSTRTPSAPRLARSVTCWAPSMSMRRCLRSAARFKCMISDEPVIRPRYTGTGQIFLSASSGGYHVFDVVDEAWILEDGAYWASDDEVELGLHREPMVTSFWAGEGFIDFQTRISGQGRVVLNAAGPVQEVELKGERLAVEGKLVMARTEGVKYGIRRPTRSIIGYWLSGEELVRTYSGSGKILMTTTPYWNQRLLSVVSR